MSKFTSIIEPVKTTTYAHFETDDFDKEDRIDMVFVPFMGIDEEGQPTPIIINEKGQFASPHKIDRFIKYSFGQ